MHYITEGPHKCRKTNTRVCVCAVLVAVIVEAVVAAQGGQSSQPDGVGEEDLCAGIDPHLKKQVRGQRS